MIAGLTTRADGAQAELGAVVRDKDGAGATVNSLRERIATLEADLENWGSRSATCRRRELQIAQMEMQRERIVGIYRDSA